MERKKINNAFDLTRVMEEVNDQLVDQRQEVRLAQAMQALNVGVFPTPPTAPERPQIQQAVAPPPVQVAYREEIRQELTPPPAEKVAESKTAVAQSTKKRASQKIKRKKGKRVKLRMKKKGKKYRGGCPVFN